MTRVAVTTAADRSERVAAAMRRHGLEPVVLPCIGVIPADDTVIGPLREEAIHADWILLTSARAVEVVWPRGGMPTTPVAAVGHATAEAASEAGGSIALVGGGGVFDLLPALGPGPGLVIAPHAAGTDPEVFMALSDAGWEILEGDVYETVPAAPDDDPVDAAAFASPSAVEGWCSARPLDGIVVGAIGATTAAALSVRGRPPDVVADTPSHTRLAAALAAHLRGRITP